MTSTIPGVSNVPSIAVRARLVEVLKPKQSQFTLRRVGGGGDGAYLVPGEILPNLDACFSAGCDNRKEFEDELLGHFGLESFLLDKSSDVDKFLSPLVPGAQFFTKKWLSVESSSDSISLADWVGGSIYRESRRLLLQLDIEEAEFSVLSATPREVLSQFSVLVVEFHGLSKRVRNSEFHSEVIDVMDTLDTLFTSIHARANNCCDAQVFGENPSPFPQVIEVTFVRKDLLDRSDRKGLTRVMAPHPKDIPRNVPTLPPQHLSSEWLDGPRSMVSVIKIALDWAVYLPVSGRHFFYVLRDKLFRLVSPRIREVVRRTTSRGRQ